MACTHTHTHTSFWYLKFTSYQILKKYIKRLVFPTSSPSTRVSVQGDKESDFSGFRVWSVVYKVPWRQSCRKLCFFSRKRCSCARDLRSGVDCARATSYCIVFFFHLFLFGVIFCLNIWLNRRTHEFGICVWNHIVRVMRNICFLLVIRCTYEHDKKFLYTNEPFR